MIFYFVSSHKSTFQLLDKPWSQASSLVPPRFLPSIFSAHRVQQSHCSSSFSSSVANSRSRVFRKSVWAQENLSRIHTSMHSGGFELTKLAYDTRLEGSLISHWGDRLNVPHREKRLYGGDVFGAAYLFTFRSLWIHIEKWTDHDTLRPSKEWEEDHSRE